MCHLEGERVADISCQTDVKTGIAQDIIDERSGRGLAVRTGDADHFGISITRRKLDLGNDRCALCLQFLYKRSGQGNTRRFDNLVGIENQFLTMLAVFPCNTVLIQQRTIRLRDRSIVGNEHVKSFLFGQDSSTATGLSCS